ncbi:MAG: hypothetical protein H0X04_00200 [Chthoniobacterales bacterium]|nr:hypothetical protein [Chthoniobacterales bacterium]
MTHTGLHVWSLLERFDRTKPVCVDCETISFDDTVKALRPYHGHRVSGIAIGQSGIEPIYLPIRHRYEIDSLLPFTETIEAVKEWAEGVEILVNINVKFDLHFLGVDGISFPNAQLHELKILARLVNNSFSSYKLSKLAQIYAPEHLKSDVVAAWAKAHNTEDYGAVPLDILGPYAKQDTVAALAVYAKLLSELPPETLKSWQNEMRCTPLIFRSEQRGFPCDRPWFEKRRFETLVECVKLESEIRKQSKAIMGLDTFNPRSPAQLNDYFTQRGIPPVAFTDPKKNKKGISRPSWNTKAMEEIAKTWRDAQNQPDPMAKALVKYNKAMKIESTFYSGWLEAMDPNGFVHASWDQAGTRSGRLSSSNPNAQNQPRGKSKYSIWEGVLIPDGRVGVHFDASQIEYRIFAHYAEDPELLAIYAAHPETDFHQILADRLGLPRDFAKMINFALLYGIGIKKLTRNIVAALLDFDSVPNRKAEALMGRDPLNIRKVLRRYCALTCADPIAVLAAIPDDGEIDRAVLAKVSREIIDEYHRMTPAIKKLQERIKTVLYARGYLKNYFGRRYYMGPDKAYVGLNYLCQGTAADIFKMGMADILGHAECKAAGVEMQFNVHDAIFADMPAGFAQRFWEICLECFGKVEGFKVPLLIDGEVAFNNWKHATKIVKNDVLGSAIGALFYLRKSA